MEEESSSTDGHRVRGIHTLPLSVLHVVLGFVCVSDLCTVLGVSRHLHHAAVASDATVWRSACLTLWRGKQSLARFVADWPKHEATARDEALREMSRQPRLLSADGRPPRPPPPAGDTPTFRAICWAEGRPSAPVFGASPRPSLLPVVADGRSAYGFGGRASGLYWWELTREQRALHMGRLQRDERRRQPPDAETESAHCTAGVALADHTVGCRGAATRESPPASRDSRGSAEFDGDGETDESSAATITAREEELEAAEAVMPVSWKFAYFMSRRDAHRGRLVMQELLTSTWFVAFRATGATHRVTFAPNHTLTVHPSMPPLAYQLQRGGGELVVHSFPPLKVRRRNGKEEPLQNASPAQTAAEAAFLAEPQTTLRRLQRERTPTGTDETQEGDMMDVEGKDEEMGNEKDGDNDDWGWVAQNYFVKIFSAETPVPLYVHQLRRTCAPRPP